MSQENLEFLRYDNGKGFENRENEFSLIQQRFNDFIRDRTKPRAVIFTSERGTGKTWFSLHLKREVASEWENCKPIFLSLYYNQYTLPQKPDKGEWWLVDENTDNNTILREIMAVIAKAMGIILPIGNSLGYQAQTLSLSIANQPETMLLIVDSAHETDRDRFAAFDEHILAPLLNTDRVFVVITGRGTRPIFRSRFFQNINEEKLKPLTKNPLRNDQLWKFSHGHPLLVGILQERSKNKQYTSQEEINDTMSKTINELLKILAQNNNDENIADYREYLERLCVLEDRPFELYEVPDFFKSDEKWDRRKIRNIHETLQRHHIIEFQSYQAGKNKGAGYYIQDFIAEPLRYYQKELPTPTGIEDKQKTTEEKEEGTNE